MDFEFTDVGQAGDMAMPVDVRDVLRCASADLLIFRERGIKLPVFDPIDGIAAKYDRAAFPKQNEGSLEIAKVTAGALAMPARDGAARAAIGEARPGPGGDRSDPEDGSAAIVTIEGLYSANAKVKTRAGSDPIRVSAAGTRGVHHAISVSRTLPAGPSTLSFEVKPERLSGTWVQVLQGTNGVTAEIDFERVETATVRIGRTRHLAAEVEPLSGGWFRVSVAATLPGGATSVVFHMLGPDGGLEFEPAGQALVLRRIALRTRQTGAQASGEP